MGSSSQAHGGAALRRVRISGGESCDDNVAIASSVRKPSTGAVQEDWKDDAGSNSSMPSPDLCSLNLLLQSEDRRPAAATCNTGNMSEIIFVVDEAPEGGFTAWAVGASIFNEADSMADLQAQIKDAVACHFQEAERPKLIRLHFVRDELIAAG
jgi:hypothetical protein